MVSFQILSKLIEWPRLGCQLNSSSIGASETNNARCCMGRFAAVISGVFGLKNWVLEEAPPPVARSPSGSSTELLKLKAEAGEECCVCLSRFEEEDEATRELPCRHLFHRACVDRWLLLSRRRTCPLCRVPIDGEPPGGVYDDDLLIWFSTFLVPGF